jgi:hypothetical protein
MPKNLGTAQEVSSSADPALGVTCRFPLPWSVEELDALLCQIESRIKKTPAFRAGVFFTQTNRALRVSGDGGKRPTCGYFGPATILNLYRIAHSVDKWDNSPSAKL